MSSLPDSLVVCGRKPRRRRLVAFMAAMAAAVTYAAVAYAAPQVVNVCGRSDAGGGLNLATAIAAGGEIVIRCPAGAETIDVTSTLDARGIVHVDGEGKVTLRGPVAGPLFTSDISLHLSGLMVTNPRTAATAAAPGAGTIILGPKASVQLDGVTTQDSLGAYVAQSFSAQNSSFLHNGDPAAPGVDSAVINADSIELHHATFTGNLDHPIAGGSAPVPGRPALSRTVVIQDSVFTGNVASMLLTDAKVSIRSTKFEGNGVAPDKWSGAWACCGGVITLVRADAEVSGSDFNGNGAGGFGGAIYALGSKLRITNSVFENNKARAGGAVMFWGRAPKVNIWSTEDWAGPLQLELERTQFHGNTAVLLGGAVLFAGIAQGDAVLFQANESGGAGGAIADWRAADLPDPYVNEFRTLADVTQPNQPDTLTLSRPILVDNRASSRGAALATGSALVAIGNGLVARNQITGAPGGGALTATKLTLANTTVADNFSGGLAGTAGATARIGNTILLRNSGFNCAPGTTLSDGGSNLQYPGTDCGGAAGGRDPGLDSQYAPGLISAARGIGVTRTCVADPQVQGVDLLGTARLQRGKCDTGAIERPLPQTVASALGLGSSTHSVERLLWVLVFLVILLFLLGLVWAVWWRRRRHRKVPQAAGKSS